MTSPASTSPFTPRTLAAWLTAVVILGAAAAYFTMFADFRPGDAVGPSTFSRSAIGHAGIADVLRRQGIGVVKSRSDSVGKLRAGDVLIVAEPNIVLPPQQLRSLLAARTVLLVLSKRAGQRSRDRPEWIERVTLLPENSAAPLLDVAGIKAEIVRAPASSAWSLNEIGPQPMIRAPMQLITSIRLRPVVAAADGMLVAELLTNNRRLVILSDPDIIQNHAIGESENAAFAVALINRLRGRNGKVVFDETVHGYVEQTAAPWILLFEFPFLLATLHGVVAIGLLLWATMGRFGAPLPPPPALASGKYGLIQNTAKLFEFAGYQVVMVQRYVQALVRDVGRQLHGPAGLSEIDTVAWLDRVGRARGVDVSCAALLQRANDLDRRRDAGVLAALASDTHRWKREIVDGAPGHSRRHRLDTRGSPESGDRPG
jgi:hypothetical protein